MNKKKHILFLSEYFYPRVAGGEKWSFELLQMLVKEGYKVTVITSKFESRMIREVVDGIEIIRIAKTGGLLRRIDFMVKLHSFLIEYLKDNDVDVIHNMAYLPCIATRLAVKDHSKVKIVTSVHSYFGNKWFLAANPIIATINWMMEKIVIKLDKAGTIHVPSSYMLTNIQKYCKNKSIIVIPNYIDEEEIKMMTKGVDTKKIRAKIGVDEKERLLVAVGNLYKIKNMGGLINAISGIKDVKLIIIGEGEEEKRIKKLIERTGLQKRVKLIGKTTRKETLGMIKAADVFVNPSLSESFSYVVMEAFVLGKKIITTDTGIANEARKESPDQIRIIKDIYNLNEAIKSFDKIKETGKNKHKKEKKEDYIKKFVSTVYKS